MIRNNFYVYQQNSTVQKDTNGPTTLPSMCIM